MSNYNIEKLRFIVMPKKDMLNKYNLEPSYADCYVLAKYRCKSSINDVLTFLFQSMDEFYIEEQLFQTEDEFFNDFNNSNDLLNYLDNNPSVEFFSLLQGKPKNNYDFLFKHGISQETVDYIQTQRVFLLEIQYTKDGGLILGISCTTFGDDYSTIIEDYYFAKLQEILQSETGYITYEEPRPDNVAEFIKITKNWNLRTKRRT